MLAPYELCVGANRLRGYLLDIRIIRMSRDPILTNPTFVYELQIKFKEQKSGHLRFLSCDEIP